MCLIFAAFSGNRAVHLYAGYRRAWLWSGEEIMTNDRRLQADQDQQQHPDALAKVQNTELLRSVPGSGAHAARLQVKRGSSQRSGPLLPSWVDSSGEKDSSWSAWAERRSELLTKHVWKLEPRFPWWNSSEEGLGQRIPPGQRWPWATSSTRSWVWKDSGRDDAM